MILVTGATGNVGREVVNLLLSGGNNVVAVTRNPATAALPDGAHVVGGDPSHPHTLACDSYLPQSWRTARRYGVKARSRVRSTTV